MTGPAPARRTLMMVETYQAGGSFRVVAWIFHVSAERVRQAVQRYAPESIRPAHVGRWESRIHLKGYPGHA